LFAAVRLRNVVVGLATAVGLVVAVTLIVHFVRPDAGPPAGASITAGAASTPVSGLPTVKAQDLPKEALATLALIDKGGPFPYDKDGSTFGNLEGLLPKRERGYYREYTVPTPGSRDRGARRLVVGRGGDVYYTADHYESFRQVLR
jgi:ribonuclease T1